ncbi:ABC transporter ATP-binding protein [Miniphocaeibacter halophilus]|uniref:ABC transporter ATP-binding protein n=1 Tax=Miniphocaeibacter halophilus TaxID=2931922 RepID=A0AC61MQL6_9FIRM|nr:ABC transporter ATP-binding protein [Miniphocaeibacter halophilus]QQK07229.1 ABC transporter ATP-binding protein [Miniphocaeibacter halophilus]
MNIIKTEGLTKYYGRSRGIDNLDLEVKKGDVFGFIGPNGSGKSTTIRLLLGLISSSKGKGEIFAEDIKKYRYENLKDIGYIPSETMFYKGMKVKDVISFSSKLYNRSTETEARKLCERFNLDSNKKVEELSLGNRKKVSIVCAFQHKPSLYILDEPTSGLDPLMQKEFFELIKERNREGATVFLSSHVLSEIQLYCNRAGIIREGKLIACDTVANLSNTQAKRVNLFGIKDIEYIDGIADIHRNDRGINFLYSGNINTLIKSLTDLNLEDITITEPSLDEIFLHYYNGGDERQ